MKEERKSLIMYDNMITQRIIKNKKRVGQFVAWKTVTNEVMIGFSLCSKQDKFDREIANKISHARSSSIKPLLIPYSIKNEFFSFKERCKKYFGCESLFPTYFVWSAAAKDYVKEKI